jgi:Alpha-2-macroglobulin bait region domain
MVQVETNSIFQPLTVVVMTGRGIAYSHHFADIDSALKIFKIPIPITAEMAPQADVIVFYLREQDGSPVHDQLRINLGMKGDNFVSFKFNFLKLI